MKIKPFKIIAVSLLIVALFVIFFVKLSNQTTEKSFNAALADPPAVTTNMALNSSPGQSQSAASDKKPASLDKETIALVNHFKITEQYLNDRYQALPAEYREEFKNDMEGFLEQIIVRELLFQHAEQKGFPIDETVTDKEQAKDAAIENFLKEQINQIQISEAEIKSFYDEHISEMRGASLEQVKTNIQNYLVQQKQGELVNQTIEQLKTAAQITRNEQWLKKQRAQKPPNPLAAAFKSGKPTVLDLGASSCIPCKMMKPIFAELEQSLKDKANVILLEISDHRDLARQYRVRVIPTQIFFDTKGEVYWRHEGFLPKEDIIKKLKEGGME